MTPEEIKEITEELHKKTLTREEAIKELEKLEKIICYGGNDMYLAEFPPFWNDIEEIRNYLIMQEGDSETYNSCIETLERIENEMLFQAARIAAEQIGAYYLDTTRYRLRFKAKEE